LDKLNHKSETLNSKLHQIPVFLTDMHQLKNTADLNFGGNLLLALTKDPPP
jgi:hypothetical protein